MYRLLFALSLFIGVSCTQEKPADAHMPATEEATQPADTADAASDEVPAALQQH
ncbi:hypothetical protein MKJ04_06720 [Pontibacter sp. E15-1]|uniref:hypothetical protein n=1 Tax=Pontibacter sp. E15-1 TaxID=2919918 RepID=UPI001F4FF476|nr:hypothetical protein [Pontibacter sp. E15-1]MCJ8164534.1 hypothetical protein [Pontibacter sp. E15-1]